jgi:RNA polymerase sigma-70 factor (ECF subfamily)
MSASSLANRCAPLDACESPLNDEPTIELVLKAKEGSSSALETLLERCLPSLRRWTHGRLPAVARGHFDTGDLVQDAVIHLLTRLDVFEPHHVGAMQAYLRQTVVNRIRDEVRRVTRRPIALPLTDEAPCDRTGPLVTAIRSESYARYREALRHLRARERALIIGRVDMEWSVPEIAERLGFPSAAAARMAIIRAFRRLARQLDVDLDAPVLRGRRGLRPADSPAHSLNTNGVAARELSAKRKLQKAIPDGKVQRRSFDRGVRKLPVESGSNQHTVIAMSNDRQ